MNDEITNIFQLFQKFPWNDRLEIDETKSSIKVLGTDNFILKKEKGFFTLNFFRFDQEENKLNKSDGYLTLMVDEKLNPINFINFWANEETNAYGYNLLEGRGNYSTLTRVFDNIDTIKISNDYKRDIGKTKKTLLLKSKKFTDIKNEVNRINQKANSSKNSLLLYLINQLKFDFLNTKTGKTTSFSKGDFEFQVHRFNLKTKTNKKEFQKYLNDLDIEALGQLFEKMLKKEVFPKEYRTRLDNYFIKESLEKIIKIGWKAINLKSENVSTIEAKKVAKLVTDEKVGQLEGIWQKFFENYLLYLFFSYKKILPKVELKNVEDNEKKYPDFIGVNHYDGVDIIEIKTHLKNILVWDNNHKNFAFSSEMSKAMIQTINYMDGISDSKFQKTKSGKELLEYLNIDENLFRPRGIIIISSKNKICKNQDKLTPQQTKQLQRDFTKLRNSMHNIQIFTFDEILKIAERYIENISIS